MCTFQTKPTQISTQNVGKREKRQQNAPSKIHHTNYTETQREGLLCNQEEK